MPIGEPVPPRSPVPLITDYMESLRRAFLRIGEPPVPPAERVVPEFAPGSRVVLPDGTVYEKVTKLWRVTRPDSANSGHVPDAVVFRAITSLGKAEVRERQPVAAICAPSVPLYPGPFAAAVEGAKKKEGKKKKGKGKKK